MKALREPLWWLIALFIGLLTGTVLLVGALTFIPALALGPVAEHFSLL